MLILLPEWCFAQNTSFYIENIQITSGQNLDLPIQVNDFDAVIGFQFTINWNPEVLDFQAINNFNLNGLDQMDFGFGGVEEGYLTCIWTESNFNGICIPDATGIFLLSFSASCTADSAGFVSFSNSPTDAILIYEDVNTLPASTIPLMIDGEYTFSGNSLNIFPVVNPISCSGQNDASIEANVAGGTTPYIYEWGGGGSNATLENLGPGEYFLLVYDANGCEAIAPFITVDAVDSIDICVVNISYDQSCTGSGACIDLTVCEPGGALTYEWSNGMTTASICNLPQGTYAVTVTNINGCSAQSDMILVEDASYSPMVTQFVFLDSTCAQGGLIDLLVANGQGAYNYNWSNGSNEPFVEDLGLGLYFCTVSDDICEVIVGPIFINAIQSDISLSSELILPVCEGEEGTINITAMSSAMPLSYLWNTGSQDENLENLSPGSYHLEITDANGCTFQSDTFLISDGAIVEITDVQIDSTTCYTSIDGSIWISAEGGTMPYVFEYNNGNTGNPVTLGAGIYSLTITDEMGCSNTVENMEILSPPALEVAAQNVVHYLDATNQGSIELTVQGGTIPYVFNWSNGGTTNPLEDLEVGEYTCLITDANDCVLASENILVDQIMNATDLAGQGIRFFPNPTKDYLYLEAKNRVDLLEFYTLDGDLLRHYVEPKRNEALDISSLKSGCYWLKVIVGQEILLTKLVVLE